MSTKIHYVGVDDGYAETKVALPNGRVLRIPSRARAGGSQSIKLTDAVDSKVGNYQTPQGPFCVGEIAEADSTANDAYPTSVLNRVIVSHALHEAGFRAGDKIAIATGLPVRRYYKGDAADEALIQAKKTNLLKNDIQAKDGSPLARIVGHEVSAEGVAAWLDYVTERDAFGEIQIDEDRMSECVAVIDIGGRTTDIAVVQEWEMDTARSSTLDVGMLTVREAVKDALQQKFSLSLKDGQVIKAIESGELRLFGKANNVSTCVRSAMQTVVERIRAEVMSRLGNGADLDQVIFVGGTVCALGELLQDWFPHQSIARDPAFANARGLAKSAELLMA